jgi:hypothetical protein
MELLQETSEWSTYTPNHIYVFDGSTTKVAGYIKLGTLKAVRFSKPMVFNKRYRTFCKINPKGFDLSAFKSKV